jgi:C4-dicarboxylate transporter, DctQ subunit
MLLRILDRAEEILIGTLMAAATLIIFVAVCHRYSIGAVAGVINWSRVHDAPWLMGPARSVYRFLADISLTWAQELCVYMFIWVAKFGAAYGVRTGIHVGVDVLINKLPPAVRSKVIIFGLLCGALFTGVIGTLGADFVWNISQTDQTSADLEMPMWIVYLAIPAGSYLMCFRFLQVAWRFARSGELPSHGHVHVEGIEAPLPGAEPVAADAARRAPR